MTELGFEGDVTSDFTSQIVGQLKSPVAAGAFGNVYRCTIESGEGKMEVAVKAFKIDPGRTTDKLINALCRELKVWRKLEHLTIVPLLGIARIDSPSSLPLALISRWMPSGTLLSYLNEPATTISARGRIKLVNGIADGLNYLHSENVVHGDLYPGNVLIDGSGNPCITDFGLATVAEDPELQWTSMTVGRDFDARWRAPEVLGIVSDAERPTFKSDIYSFGSVMFYVISGDIPWEEKKRSHQICVELSNGAIPPRPRNILDYHWDLIQKCWSRKPNDRPKATRVLHLMAQYPQGSTSHGPFGTAMSPPCTPPSNVLAKNVVIFGETGVGKSAVINLMAGRNIAATSPDLWTHTRHWEEHCIEFGGLDYKVFDTIGMGVCSSRRDRSPKPIENAYDLITKLRNEGGIDLLVLCMRAGTLTNTLMSCYRLFYEWLCEKNVPIVLVITHLEREINMENWWTKNEGRINKYGIHVDGHACITATNGSDWRHQQLYEESRGSIRELIIKHTGGHKHPYKPNVTKNFLRPTLGDFNFMRRRDEVEILTKRCGVPLDEARYLVAGLSPSRN